MPRFKRREVQLLRETDYEIVVGIDEAGRGSLAGPLSVAAVVYDDCLLKCRKLTDSKLLSVEDREQVFKWLVENVQFSHLFIWAEELDKIGLAAALHRAFNKVIVELNADYALLDGKSTKGVIAAPAEAIVKGDQKIRSIAAASIIAKVERDRFMWRQHQSYPEYGFNRHVGYGTKQHLSALRQHGICKIHRKSFAPVRELIN